MCPVTSVKKYKENNTSKTPSLRSIKCSSVFIHFVQKSISYTPQDMLRGGIKLHKNAKNTHLFEMALI